MISNMLLVLAKKKKMERNSWSNARKRDEGVKLLLRDSGIKFRSIPATGPPAISPIIYYRGPTQCHLINRHPAA